MGLGTDAYLVARPGRWGLVRSRSSDLEAEITDLYHVAGLQGGCPSRRKALAVEKGPVAGVQIAHQPALSTKAQLGVLTGDLAIVQDDVVVCASTKFHRRLVDGPFILAACCNSYLKDTQK
jgi:hypothetical protein